MVLRIYNNFACIKPQNKKKLREKPYIYFKIVCKSLDLTDHVKTNHQKQR